MPRQAKPRRHARLKRWYLNCGERDDKGRATEVFAPEDIDQRDEAAAWAWFKQYLVKRDAAIRLTASSSVRELCERYMAWAEKRKENKLLSKSHYASKQYHLGHLAAKCGPRPASSLTPDDIDDLLSELRAKGLTPNYAANIAATISAAFNWAVEKQVFARSPIAGFVHPVVPRPKERYAKRREIAAFLRHWKHQVVHRPKESRFRRYGKLTILLERILVRTGARPGELCHLWWDDINWEAGLTPAFHPYATAVIPYDRWKNGAETGKPRTIVFSAMLTRALKRELVRPDRDPKYVFVHSRLAGGHTNWKDGSTLSQTVLDVRHRAIKLIDEIRARQAAGEPVTEAEKILARHKLEDQGVNRMTNYRFRHTAASTLLMMGIDVPTIAELLGTSAEMIYRTYGHLQSDHLAEAAHRVQPRDR